MFLLCYVQHETLHIELNSFLTQKDGAKQTGKWYNGCLALISSYRRSLHKKENKESDLSSSPSKKSEGEEMFFFLVVYNLRRIGDIFL